MLGKAGGAPQRLLRAGMDKLGSRPRFLADAPLRQEGHQSAQRSESSRRCTDRATFLCAQPLRRLALRTADVQRRVSCEELSRPEPPAKRRRATLAPARAQLKPAADCGGQEWDDEEGVVSRSSLGDTSRGAPTWSDEITWDSNGGAGDGNVRKYSSRGWLESFDRDTLDEEGPQASLRIHLARSGFGDSGLKEWVDAEGLEVQQQLAGGGVESMDLSENQLTDRGVHFLVKWMLDYQVPVRRLKLFKNRLSFPIALCGLIEDNVVGVGAEVGLRELHLSSNGIAADAVARLLDSIRRRREKCGGRFDPPLWLRLERNELSQEDAERLADSYAKKGLLICLEGGSAKSGCTIQSCRHSADVHMHMVGGNKNNNKSAMPTTWSW